MALGLAELGGQERLHEVPGHRGADGAAAHAEDVHVIVLDALPRREMVVDETGADAGHFVGADRRADAAAADRHAAFDLARDDCLAERHDEIGIVVVRTSSCAHRNRPPRAPPRGVWATSSSFNPNPP